MKDFLVYIKKIQGILLKRGKWNSQRGRMLDAGYLIRDIKHSIPIHRCAGKFRKAHILLSAPKKSSPLEGRGLR
jgi:hypothetical protein